MKKDAKILLEDILASADNIQKFCKGKTLSSFKSNLMLQSAVIRQLEIIGEAAKGISADVRQKYPDVEWREICGLRDILIHNYAGVDNSRIWKLIRDDLPKMQTQLQKIARELE